MSEQKAAVAEAERMAYRIYAVTLIMLVATGALDERVTTLVKEALKRGEGLVDEAKEQNNE